jgi:hypothetical protein
MRLAPATGVKEGARPEGSHRLGTNYPNPFNPETKIQFRIENRELATLKVFDLMGREAAVLVSEVKEPGEYLVTWDASGCASGVYICRMQAGPYSASRKMSLVR